MILYKPMPAIHDAENFENPARAEDQRNEVRLAFGVVWFRS